MERRVRVDKRTPRSSREVKQEPSKLEEKQRKLQERRLNPEVSEIKDDYIKSSKFTPKDEDDSIATGLLDEEEDLDENEIPTGLLDEEEGDDIPELEVKKVEVKEDPRQELPQKSQKAEPRSSRERGYHDEQSVQKKSELSQNAKIVRSKKPQEKVRVNDEEVNASPPIRREDVVFNSTDDEKRKSGAGAVLLILVIVALMVVVLVFVLRTIRPDVLRGGNTKETLRETENFDGGLYSSSVLAAINNLYTDSEKHDIREDITSSDVKSCLDLLSIYKESDEYNVDYYDMMFGELQTISLFIQDRSNYDVLMSGSLSLTEEEYNSKVQSIENDVLMYRVQSLVSVMNAKLDILKAMGYQPGYKSTLESDGVVELDDLKGETETEGYCTNIIQNQDFQPWGSSEELGTESEEYTEGKGKRIIFDDFEVDETE